MRCVESPLPSNAEQIRRDHETSWASFKHELLHGGQQPTVATDEENRRSGISAIVRPEAEIATRLAEVARELAVLAGQGHLAFDASDIHTTLYALEGDPVADDETEARRSAAVFADVLRSLAPQHDCFHIRYEGLTAGPTGVFAQGWPSGDGFQDMRRALHRRLTGELSTRGYLTSVTGPGLRQTAHATLVSFAGPIENPASLARLVDENRSTCYGASSFHSVELVRYEATGRGIVLDPIARVPLE